MTANNMKYGLIILMSLFLFLTGIGQSHSLKIEVEGLREVKGSLMIALFDNDIDFTQKAHPIRKSAIALRDSLASLEFDDLASAFYAVAVFHDINEDGIMNKRKPGIPVEDYGFSGNYKGKMRPPKFEEVAFFLKNDSSIHIQLVYPPPKKHTTENKK